MKILAFRAIIIWNLCKIEYKYGDLPAENKA